MGPSSQSRRRLPASVIVSKRRQPRGIISRHLKGSRRNSHTMMDEAEHRERAATDPHRGNHLTLSILYRVFGTTTGNYTLRSGFPLGSCPSDTFLESRFTIWRRVPIACIDDLLQLSRAICAAFNGSRLWLGCRLRSLDLNRPEREEESSYKAVEKERGTRAGAYTQSTVRALGSASGQNPVPVKKSSSSLLAESHVSVVFDDWRQREL